MPYIGKTPTVGNFQVCDAISVVNGQAAYTLQVGGVNVAPESANHMLVSLNGILQKPGSSFTISGSTMTFASNLATGDVIDFVQILGSVVDLGQPSDDTVTAAKLNNSMISGLTALTSAPASTDEFIISDAGTLKRIDASLVVGGGKILQVIKKEVTSTISESISANSLGSAISSLATAITPSATSSKVLIIADFNVGRDSNDGNSQVGIQLLRGTTLIGNGDASSSRTTVACITDVLDNDVLEHMSLNHIDSPSTTSEITYNFKFLNADGNTSNLHINKSEGDADGAYSGRTSCNITLMEIGA